MTRLLLLFPLLAVPAASAQNPNDPKPAQWAVQGLSVVKPGPADDDGTRDFNEGTTVTALLHLPGRFLIGVDTSQSKLEAFTDDKTADLREGGRAGRLGLRSVVTASRLSADGKYAKVVFRAPGCPGAGATKVRVKGSVAALVGQDEKTVEKKDVSLKDGVDLEIGTLKVLVPAGGRAALADAATTVTYTGTKAIKAVVFLDARGTEIPVRHSLSTLGGRAAGRGQFLATFRPTDRNARLDRGTVKVTYFDRVDEVAVPVDLVVGLGLDADRPGRGAL